MHRLTETENPLGETTTYTYDRQGNLTGTVTPMGHKTTYTYDQLDRIQKVTDPSGKVTELTYDALGNVTAQTENKNRRTTYTYDAEDNQTSQTNALGETTTYTYDPMNRLVQEKSAGGTKTRYTYNKNSALAAITDGNGQTTTFAYDRNGSLALLTDAAGRQTAYSYDQNGRLTEASTGNGAETAAVTYTYDAAGNRTSQKDGNGNTTWWEYDLLGNVTKETDPLGQAETYEYDKEARLSKVTRPDGSTITYSYNHLDQLLKTAYSEETEGEVLYGYDRDGRRVSMSDLTGTSTYTYDEQNRVTGVQSGDGSILKYKYDEYGNLSQLTYPDGSKVRYTYDALDRLTTVTDREGKETVYTYDKDGNLTNVKRPNGTKAALTYDGAGQVLSVKNDGPNGKTISRYAYTYDPGGNILSEQITQDGKTTTWEYTYNSRGELAEAKATGAREETVSYAYDKAGSQVQIVRSKKQAGETLRTVIQNNYNRGGQLVERKDEFEGTTEYAYDENGSLIRELGPDETILTYEYDTENRLRAVKENGRLLQAALYDGDDNRVFVANRKAAKGQTSQTAGSNRGAGAQDTQDTQGPSGDRDPAGAQKDPENQGKDGNETDKNIQSRDSWFWYGFLQNLSQGLALTDHAVSDTLHRFWEGLTEWGHVHLLGDHPDTQGIVRSPEKELPEPDRFPEPGESGEPGEPGDPGDPGESGTAGDRRDQLSTLCRQTLIPCGVSGKERDTYELTCYINDINRAYTETLMEYDPEEGTLRSTYEYGTERLGCYDEEEGDCYAYTYDGKGSVANVTGESGESVVSYTYDPYGNAEAQGGITKEGAVLWNPYQYRGEYTDYLTGSQYLRARYYRPSTGNFLTRDTYPGDPVEPASLNRYTYAGNDPVNLEDPSGHGWLKKKVQQAKEAVKKTASKAKEVKKGAKKLVEKAKTVVKQSVKKAKTLAKKAKTLVKKAKKTVKKVVKKAAKKVKSSKLYQKARKAAAKVKKKVCTTAKRIQKATVSFVKNVDWKKVAIGAAALAVSAVVVTATGGLAAGAVVGALDLACGSLGASIVSGMVVGAIGGSTYNLVNSALSGNDAKTVFQDTLMGGFTGGIFGGFTAGVGFGLGQVTKLGEFGRTVLGGMITGGTDGGVKGLTSSLAAGDDAKTTAINTMKGIAKGTTLGGTAAAIGYGATKAGSKLLGTGVKACFVAGTAILTVNGLKKIEDIQAGDQVIARDVESGEKGEKEVLQTFEREVDVLVHLQIAGEEIVTTQTHPFYVEGKGWTEAGELTEEDCVLDREGRGLAVEGIWIEEPREPVKVYNFEVEEYHTYYVGAAEVLVHNDNCGQQNPDNKVGGAYKDIKANGGQVHHAPADSVSPYSRNKGPAIRMDTQDHIDTASWGSSNLAKQYREKQQFLIESGMFKEAQQMDIDDLHMKFGDKYDKGIEEMVQYTEQLLKE